MYTHSISKTHRWTMVTTTFEKSLLDAETAWAIARGCNGAYRRSTGHITAVMHDPDFGYSVVVLVPLDDDEAALSDDEIRDLMAALLEATDRRDIELAIGDPSDPEVIDARVLPHPLALLIGATDRRRSEAEEEGLQYGPQLVGCVRPRHEARAWAAWAMECGWQAIPSDGKRPLAKWGDGQVYGLDDIGRAYEIVTGADQLIIIDLDVDKETGEEVGVETLRGLGIDPDDLDTLQVETPSGGRHIYLRAPAGAHLPGPSAGKVGPGVDVRADRSIIVGPGSTR